MIINLSYFHTDLAVAGLEKPEVRQQLNSVIAQREPEYLRKLLGYGTAQDFITGLQTDPVEERWLQLLAGAAFTNRGRLDYWTGFTAAAPSENVVTPTLEAATFVWTVGAAGGPTPYSKSFIDLRLYNKTFYLERIGSGTMLRQGDEGVINPEYSLSSTGTTVTLLQNGVVFEPEQTYVVHVTGIQGTTLPQVTDYVSYISPIACYVYFHYQNLIASQATTFGERVSKTENSTIASNRYKQVSAWNRMVDMNRKLLDFLYVNDVTYEWYYPYSPYSYGWHWNNELFEHLNTFGI